MIDFKLESWCLRAVRDIRFPPDQRAVADELYAHMEDHRDALIAQGMDPDEAARTAVAEMGDAAQIAPLLAAIHRPFWGYFLRATRVLLALVLIAALLPVGKYIYLYHTYYGNPEREIEAMFLPVGKGVISEGNRLISYTEPDISFSDSGYTVTLERAAVWCSERNGVPGLKLLLRVFNPRPWADQLEIGNALWAEDSFGNRYISLDEYYSGIDGMFLAAVRCETSPFGCAYVVYINALTDPNAEWLDVHYDRDGRNYMLRVSLTGGASS